MILKKEIIKEEDDSIGIIDVVYESSNILKTTYFPKKELLYIYFSRGGTYSYAGINQDIYNEFENSDSQGKYFAKNIAKNKNYHYKKEFDLHKGELNEILELKKKHKDEPKS